MFGRINALPIAQFWVFIWKCCKFLRCAWQNWVFFFINASNKLQDESSRNNRHPKNIVIILSLIFPSTKRIIKNKAKQSTLTEPKSKKTTPQTRLLRQRPHRRFDLERQRERRVSSTEKSKSLCYYCRIFAENTTGMCFFLCVHFSHREAMGLMGTQLTHVLRLLSHLNTKCRILHSWWINIHIFLKFALHAKTFNK